jgi:N-methylhydantoinase A
VGSSYRLGADIGGTFTDFVLLEEGSGALSMLKLRSDPDSPATAVVEGAREVASRVGIGLDAIDYFSHGTTIALNTVIQRNGAPTGLLVTAGFRDILELQRLRLPNPHQMYAERPRPLVPRRHVKEIHERVTAAGDVLIPVGLEEVERQASALLDDGLSAIAICFLHAYRYPEHERRAKAVIETAFPHAYVCTSSEVWAEQREYERALVTVMNGYIGERMRQYFGSLEDGLRKAGMQCPVFSTKSNAGIMSAGSAGERPVQTFFSGPAAGVLGALFISQEMGEESVITLDMGGTSADIAFARGGLSYSSESKAGDFPVIMPAVDISSIGAGGGSVAWTDDQGVLRVGPRSAGAVPGPACYGQGGTEPTVTDAYLAVGMIDPQRFLDGTMPLQAELATVALEGIGRDLGLSTSETASSVLQVTTSNMYAQLAPAMALRGLDIRDFSLFAYGGAGPTHAFMLAAEVGIRKVIVPPYPGILCSLGSLIADVRGDFVQTLHIDCDELRDAQLAEAWNDLELEARSWLEDQRTKLPTEVIVVHSADMRYKGQSYDISVSSGIESAELLATAFHERYEQVYGHHDASAPVELVNLRTTIIGRVPNPKLARARVGGKKPDPESRRVVFREGDGISASVYQRSDLTANTEFEGPAIIEQYDTTTYVPPGFGVTVDVYGNLIGRMMVDEA